MVAPSVSTKPLSVVLEAAVEAVATAAVAVVVVTIPAVVVVAEAMVVDMVSFKIALASSLVDTFRWKRRWWRIR